MKSADTRRRDFLKLPAVAVAAAAAGSTPARGAPTIDEHDPSNTKLCRRLRADISDDDLLFLKQIGLRWARVNFRPPVDFDFIADADCRRRFKNIATSWALPKRQIDALIAIGGALVHDSAAYEKLVVSLGGTVPPGPSVAQVCAAYAQVGAAADGE